MSFNSSSQLNRSSFISHWCSQTRSSPFRYQAQRTAHFSRPASRILTSPPLRFSISFHSTLPSSMPRSVTNHTRKLLCHLVICLHSASFLFWKRELLLCICISIFWGCADIARFLHSGQWAYTWDSVSSIRVLVEVCVGILVVPCYIFSKLLWLWVSPIEPTIKETELLGLERWEVKRNSVRRSLRNLVNREISLSLSIRGSRKNSSMGLEMLPAEALRTAPQAVGRYQSYK